MVLWAAIDALELPLHRAYARACYFHADSHATFNVIARDEKDFKLFATFMKKVETVAQRVFIIFAREGTLEHLS